MLHGYKWYVWKRKERRKKRGGGRIGNGRNGYLSWAEWSGDPWTEGAGVWQGIPDIELTTHPSPGETPVWSPGRGQAKSRKAHGAGQPRGWGSAWQGEVRARTLWTLWRFHLHCQRLEVTAEFLMEKLEVAVMFMNDGDQWEEAIHIRRDVRSRSPMWTEILGKNKLNNPRGAVYLSSKPVIHVNQHFLNDHCLLGILGKEFCCL